MTSQPHLPRQIPRSSSHASGMPRTILPGASNLAPRERETQAVHRAPAISNAATARKTPGRGLDLPTAVASKASIPTEKSIG